MARRDPLKKIMGDNTINYRINLLNEEKTQFIQLMTMYFSAQTMLLLAYVTVLNISSAGYLTWVFSLMGLLLTLIFSVILYDKFNDMKTLNDEIVFYYPQLKGKHKFGTYFFIGIILPSMLFAFWLILIIYSLFPM